MPRKSSSALVDVLTALGIVGGVLLVLFLYTGVWPPMVVVESGSMMHAEGVPPEGVLCADYGNTCTIDPGDMVFVKKITEKDEVETFKGGGGAHFGNPGDVIVYYRMGNRAQTPIIHRAMTYVQLTCDGQPVEVATACAGVLGYRVDGYGAFGANGIFIPELGFGPERGYNRDNGYKPAWSGFITKGDNPVTNIAADQAGGVFTQPVRVVDEQGNRWIEGKARGELPWFGLIKLAISNYPDSPCNCNQYNPQGTKVLNAYAPKDLWVMLGVSLALLIFVPVLFDGYREIAARRRGEVSIDSAEAEVVREDGSAIPAPPAPGEAAPAPDRDPDAAPRR
ncbi:MAG: S26 family signal peptidase [Methanobacteriota archaeon]